MSIILDRKIRLHWLSFLGLDVIKRLRSAFAVYNFQLIELRLLGLLDEVIFLVCNLIGADGVYWCLFLLQL